MPILKLPMTYTVPQVKSDIADRVSLPPHRNFGEWIDLELTEVDTLDAPLAAEFGPGKNRQQIRRYKDQNYMRLQRFEENLSVDDFNQTTKYVCRIWDSENFLKLKRGQIDAWVQRPDMKVFDTYSRGSHLDQRKLQIDELSNNLVVIDGYLCTPCYDPQIEYSFEFLNKPKGRVAAYPSIRKPIHCGSPSKNPAPMMKIGSWPIADEKDARNHNETWYGRHPSAGQRSLKVYMPEAFSEDYSFKRLALAALDAKEAMSHAANGLFQRHTELGVHNLHGRTDFHAEFVRSIPHMSRHGVALFEQDYERRMTKLETSCETFIQDFADSTGTDLKSFVDFEIPSMEYIQFMENVALRSVIELAATLERYQNRSLDLDLEGASAFAM